jgi:hypothetical protein
LKTFGALHFVVAFTVKCMDKHKVILVMWVGPASIRKF